MTAALAAYILVIMIVLMDKNQTQFVNIIDQFIRNGITINVTPIGNSQKVTLTKTIGTTVLHWEGEGLQLLKLLEEALIVVENWIEKELY